MMQKIQLVTKSNQLDFFCLFMDKKVHLEQKNVHLEQNAHKIVVLWYIKKKTGEATMPKDAQEIIIIFYLFFAAAISSFVAASETASITVRVVAMVMTLFFLAAMVVTHYVFKRWR